MGLFKMGWLCVFYYVLLFFVSHFICVVGSRVSLGHTHSVLLSFLNSAFIITSS
jgi:hypothetical protein